VVFGSQTAMPLDWKLSLGALLAACLAALGAGPLRRKKRRRSLEQ